MDGLENQASAIDSEDLQQVHDDFEASNTFFKGTDEDFNSLLFDNEDEDEDEDYDYDGEDEDSNELELALEGEESPEEEEAESDPEVDEEASKQAQSAEENARYAEQRRQQQLQEKVQAELAQSTEYQIVKMLSEQYGVTPEEMYKQMQETAMEERAKQQGVPVEVIRRTEEQDKRIKALEDQLTQKEFQEWYNVKEAEKKDVVGKYNGIITEQDANQALDYMLNELGTTNLSLDKVVRLLHGDKLEAELKRIAKQEALAEFSGRKTSPLAPQGGKPTSLASSLTAEQKAAASALGLTDEEYLKYM